MNRLLNDLAVFVLLILLAVAVVFAPGLFPAGVQAAEKNGCTVVGTVGNVIVAHCYDWDNGGSVWANSAGFMSAEGQ